MKIKDQGTPPLSDQTKLVIKINDINEYCPKLINKSSEPYLLISREYYSSKLFTYQLSAFDYDRSDQFFPQPCITQDKLILFIGETFDECQSLLYQYFQKSELIIIPEKAKPSDIHSILLIFISYILIILMSILYLILTLCCYKRKRLAMKSSHIINPTLLIGYSKQSSL